jgi:hypothetical protein
MQVDVKIVTENSLSKNDGCLVVCPSKLRDEGDGDRASFIVSFVLLLFATCMPNGGYVSEHFSSLFEGYHPSAVKPQIISSEIHTNPRALQARQKPYKQVFKLQEVDRRLPLGFRGDFHLMEKCMSHTSLVRRS